MKLELELNDAEWSTLVELSREMKEATPARAAVILLLQNLKVFLHGKSCGMADYAKAVNKVFDQASDKTLSGHKRVMP